MEGIPLVRARAVVLVVFFVCSQAWAQQATPGSSLFDTIAEGLSRVGEKTQKLLSPRFAPLGGAEGNDFTGKQQVSRGFNRNCPVRPGAALSITNEFGEVRVEAWDNPVVQIEAEVFAGADTFDQAQQVANAISIVVDATPEQVIVRTVYPDTRDAGTVAKEVNLAVMVPADISLDITNSFGDVLVRGINGAVGVDAQVGIVDLRSLGGPTKVRARGELPLYASDLRSGGSFVLRGTQADFRQVSGNLQISNFLGSVTLGHLEGTAKVEALCDAGVFTWETGEGSLPDLDLQVWFGTLKSDMDLRPVTLGNRITARNPSPDSPQSVSVHMSFGDVVLQRMAQGAPEPPPPPSKGPWTEGILERALVPTPGIPLVIDAMAGDVLVQGADTEQVQVRAVQRAQLPPQTDALAAIDALRLHLAEEEGTVNLASRVEDLYQALGESPRRMDLVVTVPRAMPVSLRAADGNSQILMLDGPLRVEQAVGSIAAKQLTGEATLINRNGSVEAVECLGAVTIETGRGTVNTRHITGHQSLTCSDGKTIIDAPRGPVTVRQQSGDVRLIPLDGIHGDFDVAVESGSIAILVPEAADATLFANARGGIVRTALPLTGEIGKGYQRFQGRPAEGLSGVFRVLLETANGDIIID